MQARQCRSIEKSMMDRRGHKAKDLFSELNSRRVSSERERNTLCVSTRTRASEKWCDTMNMAMIQPAVDVFEIF